MPKREGEIFFNAAREGREAVQATQLILHRMRTRFAKGKPLPVPESQSMVDSLHSGCEEMGQVATDYEARIALSGFSSHGETAMIEEVRRAIPIFRRALAEYATMGFTPSAVT